MRHGRASTRIFGWLALTAGAMSCSDEEKPSGGQCPPNCASGGTTATGGTASGGTSTGGVSTGGVSTGGIVGTGGVSTGGKSSGGTAPTGGSMGQGGKAGAGAGGTASGGKGGAPSAGMAGMAGKSSAGGAAGSAGAAGSGGTGGGSASAMMNFFVTSDSTKTANLGGIEGADKRCQMLATAVGAGSKTWKAYLSTEDPVVNARDRIGEGPYFNSKGAEIAATKDALHARAGDADLFLDEKGNKINGQWKGSPTPNQHDILTGTTLDGMLSKGNTCDDWTGTSGNSQVGHSDGLGPNMNSAAPYSQWAGSHTGQCGNVEPGGGAGKIYCFVAP